jgi:BirA family biotin operon repressor/biotin-[acetyl-CoA-carboxylase] ligase
VKDTNYIHFDTIDSTNNWAKANAYSLDPEGLTCITALEQTAGRGRFLRNWLSPPGQNIYATLFFTIPLGSSFLPNLGQILALACVSILETCGFPAKIKWPNDILIEGKKVAGILGETAPLDGCTGIVLGIGINVDTSEEFLKTIDQPATSLAQLSTKTWKLEQILEPLIQQFLTHLEVLQDKGFEAFREEFEKRLAFKGEEIACNDGMRVLKGICDSITPEGRLQLRLSSGELTTVVAGDIKL